MITLLHIVRIILFVSILVLMIAFRKKIFTKPTVNNLRLIRVWLWITLILYVSFLIFFFGESVPFDRELGIEINWLKEVYDLIRMPIFVLCYYFVYKNVLKHQTEQNTSLPK